MWPRTRPDSHAIDSCELAEKACFAVIIIQGHHRIYSAQGANNPLGSQGRDWSGLYGKNASVRCITQNIARLPMT